MEPKREIKNVGKKVRQLLKDDPACRNSDMLLIFKVWRAALDPHNQYRLFETFSIGVSDLPKLPNPETIIRCRAKIQNDEHVLLPSDENVRKKRRIKQQVYIDWARTNF